MSEQEGLFHSNPLGEVELTVTPGRREELHRPGWPVIEVFGPVVQGEGPSAGRPCYFVRFGGCDYRCSWCDSLYAVDPEEVRAHATRMTRKEISEALRDLPDGPGIVILSGGNPALHDLTELVRVLQSKNHLAVHVETQGSVWRPWLQTVDQLVISPKGPSSGMVSQEHDLQFAMFMDHVYHGPRVGNWTALKIVVADEVDYEWASRVHQTYPEVPFYLSAMTEQAVPGLDDVAEEDREAVGSRMVRLQVAERYKWLCERAQSDKIMTDAVVLPQLHVIAHGPARGV